jgi:hypothetical protein
MLSDTSTPRTRPGAAARRLASRHPGSAANVEYLVTGADSVGDAKVLVVSAQLGVVEVQRLVGEHTDRDAMDWGSAPAITSSSSAPGGVR